MNTHQICFQIADAELLNSDLTRAIKDRKDFDLEQVVAALVYVARDVYAAVKNDPQSSWNEKRIATASLVNAFLTALSLAGNGEK